MEDLTEAKIIEQLKKNNFSNFNIIYDNYYKKIFFLSLKMLKDEKLAEDITQEVFVDVIKCIGSLKSIDAFDVWIRKITLNKVNTQIKNIIKHKQNVSLYDNDSLINLTSDNYLPEDLIIKKCESKELFYEINKLSTNKKRVLILYYFKEFSLKEISIIENIPIGTVKSRLFSAKSLLKKSISLKKTIASKIIVILMSILVMNLANIHINFNIENKNFNSSDYTY